MPLVLPLYMEAGTVCETGKTGESAVVGALFCFYHRRKLASGG
jgi:hypothetical protein